MKKHLKKFISLLTVAVILLSTLPIGAAAAYTKSLTVNFGFDCHIFDEIAMEPEEVSAAMKSLQFEYMDTNDNDRTYDYIGSSFSSVVVDSNLNAWDIRIKNPSFYEFYFELVAPSTGQSFGKMTIPSATENGPGIFTLDLSTVFAQAPDVTMVTFWLRKTYVPEYKGYNTNCCVISLYTPEGRYSAQKIYAKPNTIGICTIDFDEVLSAGLYLPDTLNGYILDRGTVPDKIFVDPNVVLYYDIYYREKSESVNYNDGVFSFYALLPHGERVPLGIVRPPSDCVGSYTFMYSEVMSSFVLDSWQYEALEGYEINTSSFGINSYFTITDDEVREINIPYKLMDSSSRSVRFELYDASYNLLYTEVVKIANTALTCNTPVYGDYTTFPYFVDIDTNVPSNEVQVFKCFVVDLSISYNQGFNHGFDLGQAAAPDVGASWQEGYDKGLKDGLSQNKLTAEQIQHYTKDYNAITAFFDGMFKWIKDMFFDLGDGIQYKGVKAIDIVSSVIIIAVVIWGYKTLF